FKGPDKAVGIIHADMELVAVGADLFAGGSSFDGPGGLRVLPRKGFVRDPLEILLRCLFRSFLVFALGFFGRVFVFGRFFGMP
ncbi:MAG: hypothetical protein DSZ24_00815, partial [Thermodesulfatator sp.]